MIPSIFRIRSVCPIINLILFSVLLLGNNENQLTGRVIDKKTGAGMSDVNILVRGTFTGTTTGKHGIFQITFIDTGENILEVSRIGYEQKNIAVNIAPGFNEILVELEEQALFIPRVVVTASRREQHILESPVSVSVLSLRSVEERSIVDLEEALATEVGVSTVNGQLNIRGSSGFAFGTGNRSLVLIDHVPVLGSAAGNMTWSMVPTSEISQVEIVRSGGSTLYGSSAMGGVINIITRMPAAKPETSLMIKSGYWSNSGYSQWEWRKQPGFFHVFQVSHSRQFGPHGAWFRVQQRNNDGYSELGWERSINFTGKAKFNFNQNSSGSVFANYYQDKAGLASQWKSPADPYEAPAMDKNNSINGNKLHINSFFNIVLTKNQVLKLKGAYFGSNWEHTTAARDFSLEKRAYGELQHTGTWTRGIQTTVGLVSYYSTIDAKIFGLHDTRSTSGYVLFQSHLGRKLTALSGIRGEWYQVDGSIQDQALAPQVAINLKQNDAVSYRASYSRGFRVPSVAELFSNTQLNVFRVEPNPGLKAEKSTSTEVGMSLAGKTGGWISYSTLDLAIFNTNYEQLIEPTPDNYGIIHFENLTEARITGMELAVLAGLFKDKIVAHCAYTWLNPVETNNNGNVVDTLSYRFRHTLFTSTKMNIEPFIMIIENRYSSRMEKVELFDENDQTSADKRVPISVWNVGINTDILKTQVQLRINNIFQYNYTELERNMAPGRAISLSVLKTF